MILIVVGILSAVAIGRMVDTSATAGATYGDQARGMLRYAQKLAVAQNREIYVSVTSTRMGLCADANCTSLITAPDGSNNGTSATLAACGSSTWYCAAIPSDISSFTFYFDKEGRPFNGTDPINSDSSTFTGLSATITGATPSVTVKVEAETGYVH